jgi:hypothetical protein
MLVKVFLSMALLALLAGCGLFRSALDESPAAPPTQSVAAASPEATWTATVPPMESVTEQLADTSMEGMHAQPTHVASPLVKSMSHERLHAGSHIQLTKSLTPTQEDVQRADEFIRAALQALGKYKDYHQALEDDYVIFGEDVPQDVYHFINYRETLANLDTFDPSRPTALLYKKTGDGWRFVGAMYSAPWGSTEEELNERYPLSMAQWHAHVKICVPRDLQDLDSLAENPTFGFEGSIASDEECSEAGGRFFPNVLGWMVHVYF